MNSLRKWLYKPKKSDQSLLAQFYFADEELNGVAAALDGLDSRKEPERCQGLVAELRACQDRVLTLVQRMMADAIPTARTPRDFRSKFPDDVVQENLAGQLWFGAECLAAGSSIMNRELESAAMRPLARALTKNLDSLRHVLRDQCLLNSHAYTERIREGLTIFDKLFAEFELSYVSAMVPVKSVKEYETIQEITVLFSETVIRAKSQGYITTDMIDEYDPALMFTIPRLAIVCGLLVFAEGPLNPNSQSWSMSDMFRPFQTLLYKIRELLFTLSAGELATLERALCSQEEPDFLSSPAPVSPSGLASVGVQTDSPCNSLESSHIPPTPEGQVVTQDASLAGRAEVTGQTGEDAVRGLAGGEGAQRPKNLNKSDSRDSGLHSDGVSPSDSQHILASTDPTDPTHSSVHPTDPAHCTVHPTDPAHSTVHPTDPAHSTVHPTDPAYSTVRSIDPAHSTVWSTDPAHSIVHPTDLANSTDPAHSIVHPTDLAYSTDPAHSTVHPTDPAYSTVRSIDPAHSTVWSTDPAHSIVHPTDLAYSTDSAHSTAHPTDLAHSTVHSIGPAHSTVLPLSADSPLPTNLAHSTLATESHSPTLEMYLDSASLELSRQCDGEKIAPECEDHREEKSKQLAESDKEESEVFNSSSKAIPGEDRYEQQISDGDGSAEEEEEHFYTPSAGLSPLHQPSNTHLPSALPNTQLLEAVHSLVSAEVEAGVRGGATCLTSLHTRPDADIGNADVSSCGRHAVDIADPDCTNNADTAASNCKEANSADNGAADCRQANSADIAATDCTNNADIADHDCRQANNENNVSSAGTKCDRCTQTAHSAINNNHSSKIHHHHHHLSRKKGGPGGPTPTCPLSQPAVSADAQKSSSRKGDEKKAPPSLQLKKADTKNCMLASSGHRSGSRKAHHRTSMHRLPSPRQHHRGGQSDSNSQSCTSHTRGSKREEGRSPHGWEETSSCSSGCEGSSSMSDCESDQDSCGSSETSSYNSESHDDEEIALAVQAAELANRNQARARFRSSSDMIHRLFVCISGVADQLQTNFAGDLRNILRVVFNLHCSEPVVVEDEKALCRQRRRSRFFHQPMGSDLHSRDPRDPPAWIPDDQATVCMSCKTAFTFVRRRHHCRNCGKVFCGRCSSNAVSLPHFGHSKPVRVCNHCFVFQVNPFAMQAQV